MTQLYVWGTLKKGRGLHWLLLGCKLLDSSIDGELYAVPPLQLGLIDVIEFLCGYLRVPYQQVNRFIYVKG